MRKCMWENSRNCKKLDNGDYFYILLSRGASPASCHLPPSSGPSWPRGCRELTESVDNSASGLASSTLWSTARRAHRDWGEAETLRWACETWRLRAGRKLKSTCENRRKSQPAHPLSLRSCSHPHVPNHLYLNLIGLPTCQVKNVFSHLAFTVEKVYSIAQSYPPGTTDTS